MFLAPPTHNTSELWLCADTKKISGPTSITECEETDKAKKFNRRKVTLLGTFGNSSPTWSLTNDRPALGPKCVSDHQPLPSSQQTHPKQNSESMSLCHHASISLPTSSQQTSPTACTSQISLQQRTIAAAFSAIAPYKKKPKRYKDITRAITYCTATDMMPISTV